MNDAQTCANCNRSLHALCRREFVRKGEDGKVEAYCHDEDAMVEMLLCDARGGLQVQEDMTCPQWGPVC